MSERRDKFRIIYDMLCSIKDKGGKIKPTHLMYKANLSHSKMQVYLGELIKKEMVIEEETEDGKRYKITEGGIKLINEYQKIKEFTDSFGF